jgi:DNA-binding NtrC family response regulator
VEEGRFREDLFYRLNVIALAIPPLRERREDIPELARAFVTRYATEMQRGPCELDEDTVEILRAFDWPGNVRQLRNAIERMVVLTRGPRLTPDLLPPEIVGVDAPSAGAAGGAEGTRTWREALENAKREILREALARHDGNQTRAAEELGLQRTYLNRLLKDLDVE